MKSKEPERTIFRQVDLRGEDQIQEMNPVRSKDSIKNFVQ